MNNKLRYKKGAVTLTHKYGNVEGLDRRISFLNKLKMSFEYGMFFAKFICNNIGRFKFSIDIILVTHVEFQLYTFVIVANDFSHNDPPGKYIFVLYSFAWSIFFMSVFYCVGTFVTKMKNW